MKALRGYMSLLIACSTLFSARALAQYTYYAQEDFRRCRGQLAATDATAGGIGGGAVVAVTSVTNNTNQALGALTGTPPGGGGLFGYGLSCEEEIRLTGHLFNYANDFQHRYKYYIPYNEQGVRIAQVVSGYDGSPTPNFCRLYHVEFVSAQLQPRALRTTMCYVGNRWMIPNAAPGVPVIVRQQNVANPEIRVPVAPGFPQPGPAAPRPAGPYRFAPEIARQNDPRLEIRPMAMPTNPMPAYGPVTPGVYARGAQ